MNRSTLHRTKRYLAMLLSLIMAIGILPVLPSYAAPDPTDVVVVTQGTHYTVDTTGNTIVKDTTDIFTTTTVDAFTGNLTFPTGATFKVVADGTSPIATANDIDAATGRIGTDTLVNNDILCVYSQDRSTVKNYVITVATPSINASVTTQASHYTVTDGTPGTIVAQSTTILTSTTVTSFLGNLTIPAGATTKVVVAGTTPLANATDIGAATGKNGSDALVDNDILCVVAQDGSSYKLYTITVTAPSNAVAVTTKTTHYTVDSTANTIVANTTIIKTTTTVNTLLGNLNQPSGSTWKLVAAGTTPLANASDIGSATAKSGTDTLTDNDLLCIVAQDGSTIKVYTITVAPLSNNASVTTKSTHYNVTDGAPGTIAANTTPIQTDTLVSALLANLNQPADSTWKVIAVGTTLASASDITNATAKSNSAALVNGDFLGVVAEDGTAYKVYTLTVTASSSATVTTKANHYTVDSTANTIVGNSSDILTATTVADFVGNLNLPIGSTYKVVATGTALASVANIGAATGKLTTDTLANGDRLAIIAEDGTTFKVYTLTVATTASAVTLSSIATSTDGTKLILSFNKAMADPTGKHTEFTVKLNGYSSNTARTLTLNTTAAALGSDPTTIELTMQNPIQLGDVVTVSYTGTITSSGAAALDAFTNTAVTNTIPYVIPTNLGGTWIAYDHVGNWGETNYPTGDDSRGNAYNRHILISNGGSTVRFYGYGSPGYKDFLFLPSSGTTAKSFEFQLNTAGVNYHSMEGGGFIFNAEIVDGKISGYAVLFLQAGVSLLRLHQVDAEAMHQITDDGMAGATGVTELQTFTLPAGTVHDIKLQAGADNVEMWDTVSGNTTKIIDNFELPAVYSGGLGMIASYSSHGCSILSYFEFSNLQIKGVVNLSAALADSGTANLTFSSIADATSAVIEQSTDGITFTPATLQTPLTLSDTTKVVTGLTPATKYFFRIVVTGGVFEGTSKVATAAYVIKDLTATAGDKKATLRFTAPTGSTNVKVYKKAPTDTEYILVTGTTITPTTTTCEVPNLTNGVTYQFKLVVTGGTYEGTSNVASATPRVPSSSDDSYSPPVVTPPVTDKQIIVIVNGKEESAGTEKSTVVDNRVLTNLVVNPNQVSSKIDEVLKLNDSLPPAQRVENVVKIPVGEKTLDKLVVNITGDVVKKMEDNNFKMSVQQDMVEYIIPAKEITVTQVASKLGVAPEALKNIEIQVRISKSDSAQTTKFVSSVEATTATVVVKPIEFEVVARTTATDGKTSEVLVDNFTSYVERVVELPDGIDWSKITTGIVFNPDGTFAHVPTYVFMKDNKYFARLNSLTNSPYSIVWNPITIASVEKHWSKNYVNDMASRMVVSNVNNFSPDQAISRAMFADYLTKALGVNRDGAYVDGQFKDVTKSNPYADAITQAVKYNLMTVDAKGNFNPNGTISRQDAMVIFEKAMKVITLASGDPSRLKSYSDSKDVSATNNPSATNVVSAKIFNGYTTAVMAPKSKFTQAEAATAIRNMLLAAGLIDDYYKRVK